MPIIRFRRSAPNQTGDAPATGYYRFSLNKPLTIPGDPDEVITTAPFKVGLVLGGVEAELVPTPAGYAWQVLESIDGIPDVTYWVTVPDVPGPLDDGDLTRVNPSTLSPRAAPEAAWWPVANATITDATVQGDDLVLTRHDGSTVNAGRVTPTPEALAGQISPAVDAAVASAVEPAVADAVTEAVGPAVTAAVGPAVTTAVAATVGPAATAAVEAAARPSNMALDTDGVPFISPGSNTVFVYADTDGRPYFVS